MGARKLREGGVANGYEVCFWSNENDLKLIVVMVAKVSEYPKNC